MKALPCLIGSLLGALLTTAAPAQIAMVFSSVSSGGRQTGGSFTSENTITGTAAGDSTGGDFLHRGGFQSYDSFPPLAVCKNVVITYTGGTVTIVPADVDNGSSDDWGTPVLSVDPSSFDGSNLGANPVTLTVTDLFGHKATCSATVTLNSGLDDTDGDSIFDVVEDAGPNGGDGNNDGTLDSLQINVVSLPNGATTGFNVGQYVTLVGAPGTEFSSISTFPAPTSYPSGVTDFPIGLVSFTLTNASAFPALNEVQLIAEEQPNPLTSGYWKHDGAKYIPFTSISPGLPGASFNGERSWTIRLVDSSVDFAVPSWISGDSSLIPNVIVDPGGPGVGTVLLATFDSLRAVAIAEGVRIEWTTISEVDNAGFNVYRAEGASSVKLNTSLIPAEGNGTGLTNYSFVDATPLTIGEARYYYVEDVDLVGATTLHGPVSPNPANPNETTVRDWTTY